MCGYAPEIFVCNHCGTIFGAGEIRCSNCHNPVNYSHLIPASPEVLQEEYQKACDRLAHATNTYQLTRLVYYFDLLSGTFDVSQQRQQLQTQFEAFRTAEQQEQAYAQLKADLSLPLNNESLENCAAQLSQWGAYKEAPAILEQVQQQIQRNNYEAADCLQAQSSNVSSLIAAAEAFEALGDFADAPMQAKACRKKAKAVAKNKQRGGRIALISIISVLLATVLLLTSAIFFLPMFFYGQGQRQLDAGLYTQAEASFRKAGNFRDAPAMVKETICARHYAEGLSLFAQGKYLEGAQQMQAASGYRDAEAQILNMGWELISQKQYDTALSVLGYSSDVTKGSYIHYANGLKALDSKDYKSAVAELSEAGDLQDTSAKLQEASYAYGLECITKGDFATGSEQFSQLGAYQQAKELALLCQAEDALGKGHLNTAIKSYAAVPNTLVVDGINIAARKTAVSELTDFAPLCGMWTSSSHYVETRQVKSSDNSWKSWFYDNDTKIADQTIQVVCLLEKDGTITVKGSVTFRHFTNYAAASDNCTSTNTTKEFEMAGLTAIPNKITVDSNTVLNFSDGRFSLEYSKQESASGEYQNIYSSKVTYGTQTETY